MSWGVRIGFSKFGRYAAGLAIAALFLVTSPRALAAERVLHRGGLGGPATLDSQASSSGAERTILLDLFTGLLTLGPAGDLASGAAVSWSVSKDGKTYRFELREGLRWSDGVALTADDYVYGLRRLMDPETANFIASNLYSVVNAEAVNRGEKPLEALGVRRVGEREIQVELHSPTAYFPEIVATMWDPAPRHVIEEHGTNWARPGLHVSNGPFKLAEWVPSQYVRLVKNDHFFAADDVALDEVYHYPAEDLSAALRRFRAGELHVVSAFPNPQLGWVRENLPDSLRVTPIAQTETLLFNTSVPPLDDARVRQALSMAINRELIVDKILKGGEQPAFTVIPPSATNYPERGVAPFQALSYPDRVRRAKELLAEAGFGPGNALAVELRLNASESRRQVAVAVASMWKPLGVRVSLLSSEDKVRLSDMQSGNFQIVMSLRATASTDPFPFLHTFSTKAGPRNATRYLNPAFDRYLDEAVETVDLDERAGWLLRAETELLEDQPAAALYFYASKILVSPRVSGWIDNSQGENPSRYLGLK